MKIGVRTFVMVCAAFSNAFAQSSPAGPSSELMEATRAVESSDSQLLSNLIKVNPTLASPQQASRLIDMAAFTLAGAPQDKVGAAQEVIRILVKLGAKAGEPNYFGMDGFRIPISVIGRRPGERSFILELLWGIPEEQRCAVLANMIDDGNPGQWEYALDGIATVPVSQRHSSTCGAIFKYAARGEGEFVTRQTEMLLNAGLFPDPEAMVSVAQQLPDSPAARKVLVRLLSGSDLAATYLVKTEYSSQTVNDNIFSQLFLATMRYGVSPLQENLSKIPEWNRILSTHGNSPSTCEDGHTYHLDDAAELWERVPEDTISQERLKDVEAGTRWLIAHCAPQLKRSQSQANWANTRAWTQMALSGHPDLVMLGLERGVIAEGNKESLRQAALLTGSVELFIRLYEGEKAPASLDEFMADLAPLEQRQVNGGDIEILHWLIDHGTNPSTPVFGVAPIAVARFFDRDDITQVLSNAGVKPTVLEGKQRDQWLQQRLNIDAGFDRPIQVIRDESSEDGSDSRRPSGGLEAVDLNGDGKPEYINYGGYCGNVNCEFAVLTYRDRKWGVVLSDGADSVDVQRKQHNGWKDIVIDGRASAAEHDKTRYQYNGHKYVVGSRSSIILK